MSQAPVLTRDDVQRLLEKEFPQTFGENPTFVIEDIGRLTCRLRSVYDPRQIRPGGTLSGPTVMALADAAIYVAILASIGPQTLAVTTNLSCNFLRKPEPRDLLADCRLIKLGKRLAVGDVSVFSDGGTDLVAHATGTYSIPPR